MVITATDTSWTKSLTRLKPDKVVFFPVIARGVRVEKLIVTNLDDS